MPRAFTIGTVGGVVIRARMSAPIAFVILVWFLASFYLPEVLQNQGPITLWSVAFISALALYVSTIVHELAHCLVARARSVPVDRITVSLFGGQAEIPQEYPRPLDESLISLSGPILSAAIAGVAFAIGRLLPDPSPPLELFLEATFLLNGWLAIYNFLPVLPLDGGRAIRGFIWQVRGDFAGATNIAVMISRLFAGALAVVSLALLVFSADRASAVLPAWLPSDGRYALIGLLLAYLLNNGARNVQRNAETQARLAGLTVAKVMTSNPPTVTPGTSLEEIAAQHFAGAQNRAVAVVRDDGTLAGLIVQSDLMNVPADQHAEKTASQIMTLMANLVTVAPEDPVETAIRHMAHRHFNQLPVVEDGRLVGMIDRGHVLESTQPAERHRRFR